MTSIYQDSSQCICPNQFNLAEYVLESSSENPNKKEKVKLIVSGMGSAVAIDTNLLATACHVVTNLEFDNCISTILLPKILPSFIIDVVVIIFKTNFWAVPAFILVLPVTNSGPTIISIGISATKLNGELILHTIHPVEIPFF